MSFEKILQIEPENELKFKKEPFNSPMTASLKLKNISNRDVSFTTEIRGTNPKALVLPSYLLSIRPDEGTLAPGGQLNIEVAVTPHTCKNTLSNLRLVVHSRHDCEDHFWGGNDLKRAQYLLCIFDMSSVATSQNDLNAVQEERADVSKQVQFDASAKPLKSSLARVATTSFACGLSPKGDHVVVQKAKAVKTSKGGIVIPEKAEGKILEGTIVAVGPGAKNEKGEIIPIGFLVGDAVILPAYDGTKVEDDDGKELEIYKEHEIVARRRKN